MAQRGLVNGMRRLALAPALAVLAVACGSSDGVATALTSSTTISDQDVAGSGPAEGSGDVTVDAASGTTAAPPPAEESQGATEAGADGDGADGDGADGDGADGDGAGAGPESAVAADTSELTGAELEAFVVERYWAYWDALDAARQAPTEQPTTDFPLLAELAAGSQLETSYQTVIDLARAGEAIREPVEPSVAGTRAADEHRVRVDRMDGTVADLSVCVVNDDVRLVVADGAIVWESVTTVLSTATMALTEGRWKLIRAQATEIADGVTGCWLTPEGEFPY